VDADELHAYVREESGDEPAFRASFTVTVQRDGQRWWRPPLETLEGVDLRTAVAWARERAPVVLVTIGDEDELWSAGDRNPAPESFPQLPAAAFELTPRRHGARWDGSMPPGAKQPGPLRRLVARWWPTATFVAVYCVLREAFDLHGFWEQWALVGGLLAVVIVGVMAWPTKPSFTEPHP
jgi:hypothetical protein